MNTQFVVFPAIIIAIAVGTGYLCAIVAGRAAITRGPPPKKWTIWAAFWGRPPCHFGAVTKGAYLTMPNVSL
jgi:hypothetical protein